MDSDIASSVDRARRRNQKTSKNGRAHKDETDSSRKTAPSSPASGMAISPSPAANRNA